MKKIAETIIRRRGIFLAVFGVLVVFSIFSSFWVQVENDFTVYLPDTAEAKRGLDMMNNEFKTFATADIMVEDVTKDQAQRICDDLSATEGVYLVSFDLTADHYRDGKAMYTVSFDGEATEETALNGLANVKAYLSDKKCYLYSDSFSSLPDILAKEMRVISIIVVIVVVGVLLFTSSSYVEPIVMLLTFIVAAIINLGTNFLMGTISFVSNSVAVVMQLALSVDYAIIYCNRYKAEHATKPIREAAVDALAVSIPEIAASSLTTIAGLTAMMFMQFRLGFDMGMCLIKAIFLSLLSVFLFMPAILMAFGKRMDKTQHRSFVPRISFVGKFAYKTRLIVPILFAFVLVFSYISCTHINYAYYTDLVETSHKNEEDIAYDAIYGTFGKNNLVAVMFPNGDFDAERQMAEDLLACDEVNSVLSLATYEAMDGYSLGEHINYAQFMELADVDELTAKGIFAYYAADKGETARAEEDLSTYEVPLIDLFLCIHDIADTDEIELTQEQKDLVASLYTRLFKAQEQLQGEEHNRMLLYMNLTEQSDETFAFLEEIHTIGERYFPEGSICLTGNAVSTKDFSDTFDKDINIVGILSIVLVMLILLLTFRSFGMPILLIVVIQGSIWLNFSIAVWTGTYVFFMCYLICSAIQMGANIDYAIVISSRYNELRSTGLEKREAMIQTINFSFPTVITSGSMMIVAGLAIGALVSHPVIAGMGHYVGTGTTISVVLVNFVLPQILMAGEAFSRRTEVNVSVQHTNTSRRLMYRAATALLAVGVLVSAVMLPGSLKKIGTQKEAERTEFEGELTGIDELRNMLSAMSEDELTATKLLYAKSLVSYSVADEKVTDGEKQLSDGEKQLSDAKEQLSDGEKQYEDGLRQYNEGLAAYEAGQQQLAEGQAEYDAGVAQLEEAKQTYAEGQAKLEATEPLIESVMPLYEEYRQLQAQYDEAVSSGDLLAATLYIPLMAAKSVYEAALGGYSLSGLMASYEEGKAQLEAGAQQIAEAEAALADAKVQLDDGYAQAEDAKAQLEAAERQLAEARKKLDDGAAEIKDGEKTLKSSKKELQAGQEMVDGFQQDMEAAQTDIALQNDKTQTIVDAVRRYRSIEEISRAAGNGEDYNSVLTAAEGYYTERLNMVDSRTVSSYLSMVTVLLSCVLAALALVFSFLHHGRTTAILASGAFVTAGAALILRLVDGNGYAQNVLFLALLLCVTAALFLATGYSVAMSKEE